LKSVIFSILRKADVSPQQASLYGRQDIDKGTVMKLVILESPFAGNVERNKRYARAAVRDSLLRGEAPIASHLLYTQEGILDDTIPAERQMGIDAGLAWRDKSEGTVVYNDFGCSQGMLYGIERAEESGKKVEIRQLPREVFAELFPEGALQR
jgi:hypothetical protein